MEPRPEVIVVCGMNHSGTSCIAEYLVNNGADPGNFDESFNEVTPYVKYENALFKSCCIKLAMIQGLQAPQDSVAQFKHFIESYQSTKPLMMKYPKSVFCLNLLRALIGDDRMKTVFVMRNTVDAVESNMRKSKADAQQMFGYYYSTYKALLEYEGDVFITSFERIRSRKDTSLLLQYCGLAF
jgi:hypothetical protein